MKRIRKSTWFCICMLSALFLSGCTTRTAVNEHYGLCLMVQDGLYLCDDGIKEENLPEGFREGGSVASVSGGRLPERNLEANDLDKGTPLYLDPGEPGRVYAFDADKARYLCFLRCETCVVLDGALYVDDPRTHWRDEETLPERFSFAGEVAAACTSGIPSGELAALGLPVGTALYREADNAQYIYACVAEYGRYQYRKLSRFADVRI